MTPLAVTLVAVLAQLGAPTPPTTQQFLTTAHAATVRYQDLRAAIADGYRAVGPDFPGMGEHWVHPGLLVGGRLDAARPQILEYAVLEGRRTLVGVAYATLARDGEVPEAFPVARDAWHFHGGTVDEESFVLSHIGAGHDHSAGPRLAVLHAWVWLANPAGVFATDNWALPYARLGFHAPPAAPVAAARAMSLVGGGDVYLDVLVRALGRPDSSEAAALQAVVRAYRGKVEERVRPWERGAELDGANVAALAALWVDLCAAFDTAAGSRVGARLEPLKER